MDAGLSGVCAYPQHVQKRSRGEKEGAGDFDMGDELFKGLAAPQGMRLDVGERGVYVLTLEEPVGHGRMRGVAASPDFIAATVDFWCESCPNMVVASTREAGWFSRGTWFTVNYCLEGRCEVFVPHRGFAVVKASDCCISGSHTLPDEFRYPLGRYRGVELFVNTDIVRRDAAFSLLAGEPRSVEGMVGAPGFAAVFSGDRRLNGIMERIGEAMGSLDTVRMRYELLGLLLELLRRDMGDARPRGLLTKSQMSIAHAARDEVERSLGQSHDARLIAARLGVSAATLNRYFADVYGCTVAAYVRRRRMEEASALLTSGVSVADASLSVGYANPSKFAAAFKRAMGVSPSSYRRAIALDAAAHTASGEAERL